MKRRDDRLRNRYRETRPLMRGVLVMFAVSMTLEGCKKADAIDCMPPPANPTCPDAAPSFEGDVYPNVFVPVCVTCHSPTGVEPSMPFLSYQQIYGSGSEAKEIFNQVFESCLMPPPGAAVSLTDDQRQLLLDWFACGAPDSASLDGGARD